jgi:hypothetical protein
MKPFTYFLAVTSLTLIGCVAEPPVTTTTTVTREVTTTGPATREVIVAQAPPAVRVETRTVPPGPNYIWSTGYWRWTGTRYVWVSGGWIARPQPTAVWVEGHWVPRPGGWVWVAGHWQ